MPKIEDVLIESDNGHLASVGDGFIDTSVYPECAKKLTTFPVLN
jgi:hypothetical protein